MIERGWEVVGSDGGRVGEVDEVLGDLTADIFDGLTVDQGLTKPPRYVPAERVAQILEGRVVLDANADAFESESRSGPARRRAEPALGQVCVDWAAARLEAMLSKLMWTGLYAAIAAAATVAARAVASKIWRIATGEAPPVKK